jgi:hypothetical protein
MNRAPDVELVLRDYFADDISTAPDHVLDVIEERIKGQPQQRAWRVLRRDSHVNSYLKPLLAVAAVIVLAVAGIAYFGQPSDSGVGGAASQAPSPSPVPSAAPSPSAAQSPSGVTPLPEGAVPGGTYRLTPLASAPSLTVDAIVPATWIGGPPCCLAGPVGESNGPDGIALHFLAANSIFSDPCHWNVDGSGPGQPGDIEVGPSVDELAAALAANAAYEATAPTDVTIGGFAGKRVDLQLPPGECDTLDGNGVYFVFGGREGYIYAQGDGSDWQVSIVDVDGTRLIVALFSYAGTSASDLSAAQAIIDSLVITP